MSQRTLEVHWGLHHRGYVEALNKQLEKNDSLYGCTMDELIKVLYNNGNPFPEFNDAAQVCPSRWLVFSVVYSSFYLPLTVLNCTKNASLFSKFKW